MRGQLTLELWVDTIKCLTFFLSFAWYCLADGLSLSNHIRHTRTFSALCSVMLQLFKNALQNHLHLPGVWLSFWSLESGLQVDTYTLCFSNNLEVFVILRWSVDFYKWLHFGFRNSFLRVGIIESVYCNGPLNPKWQKQLKEINKE